MKILWVSPFFPHPADCGGKISTLERMRELHKRHEIHFAALNAPANLEAPQRAGEYSTSFTAIPDLNPSRVSAGMVRQLHRSVLSPLPVDVLRFVSPALKRAIRGLLAERKFDSIVCDMLASAPNMPDLGQCVLLQHNVETTILERHLKHAATLKKRTYFSIQTAKMKSYEGRACRASRHVIAHSEIDANRIESMFGVQHVTASKTGTDVDYFRPRNRPGEPSDLVFCGAMDWLPNVDAIEYFASRILPSIIARRPQTTITIVGRSPHERVLNATRHLPGLTITGTVPDVRPWLWGSRVSIVPLRIGGGTRMKIYEAMASGLPVVSTSIGAEGLLFHDGKDILIADSPSQFADACVSLLNDPARRAAIANQGLQLVQTRFSWSAVMADFEQILERNRITARM